MKEDGRTEDYPNNTAWGHPMRPFVLLNVWQQELHVEQVPARHSEAGPAATGAAARPCQPIGCTHRMAHRRNPNVRSQ